MPQSMACPDELHGCSFHVGAVLAKKTKLKLQPVMDQAYPTGNGRQRSQDRGCSQTSTATAQTRLSGPNTNKLSVALCVLPLSAVCTESTKFCPLSKFLSESILVAYV